MKTQSMNDGTRKRRVECASELLEKFRKNPCMVERVVFQHESILKTAVFTQKSKEKYQVKTFVMEAESK